MPIPGRWPAALALLLLGLASLFLGLASYHRAPPPVPAEEVANSWLRESFGAGVGHLHVLSVDADRLRAVVVVRTDDPRRTQIVPALRALLLLDEARGDDLQVQGVFGDTPRGPGVTFWQQALALSLLCLGLAGRRLRALGWTWPGRSPKRLACACRQPSRRRRAVPAFGIMAAGAISWKLGLGLLGLGLLALGLLTRARKRPKQSASYSHLTPGQQAAVIILSYPYQVAISIYQALPPSCELVGETAWAPKVTPEVRADVLRDFEQRRIHACKNCCRQGSQPEATAATLLLYYLQPPAPAPSLVPSPSGRPRRRCVHECPVCSEVFVDCDSMCRHYVTHGDHP